MTSSRVTLRPISRLTRENGCDYFPFRPPFGQNRSNSVPHQMHFWARGPFWGGSLHTSLKSADILAVPKQFLHASCCTMVVSCERSTPTPAILTASEMGNNTVCAGRSHCGQRGSRAFSLAGVEDSSSSLFHLHSRPQQSQCSSGMHF